MNEQSLDHAFLRYFGVSAAGEEKFHAFYLPFLEPFGRILDLGSGMGGFVELLHRSGKDAYGVDSDPGCVADSRSLGLPIVEEDVVEHLRNLEPESLDAIFSAHLVEHLPYEATLEVIQLAWRALRPGGRLLLVTPNPRALVSHLELYHQHFGHLSFYQPELLAFFMDYAGFAATQTGENPDTSPHAILPMSTVGQIDGAPTPFQSAEIGPLPASALLPRPNHLLRRLIWYPKRWLIQWLVQPFIDRLAAQDRVLQSRLDETQTALSLVQSAFRHPFESYTIGDKANLSGEEH